MVMCSNEVLNTDEAAALSYSQKYGPTTALPPQPLEPPHQA